MKETFVHSLTLLARKDPRVVFIVGDVGFGMIETFQKEFPKQFINAGIAEQNMIGLATGLGLEGKIVFVYSLANFATLRCLEHIRNGPAYHKLNVNLVAMGGGFSYGPLGLSHHATEDIAVLRAIPGVTVCAPGDLFEVASATDALYENEGVGYLRLDKSWAESLQKEDWSFQLGKSRKLSSGKDLTIISTGGILGTVLEAAENLAILGIRCRVLSMHTVSSIDRSSVLSAAEETGGILTVEEHGLVGGLGSAVAECLMDAGVSPRFFHRLAFRDGFMPVAGTQAYLRKLAGLDAESIARTAQVVVNSRFEERETNALFSDQESF